MQVNIDSAQRGHSFLVHICEGDMSTWFNIVLFLKLEAPVGTQCRWTVWVRTRVLGIWLLLKKNPTSAGANAT